MRLENRHENALKDEDVYPVDTVVRIRKTGLFAIIKYRSFLRPEQQKYFLDYEAEIEGKQGRYTLMHQDIDLEVLPSGYDHGQKDNISESWGVDLKTTRYERGSVL